MNCERVVRNADTLSPPLVVFVPMYSCAYESYWMSIASDVSDVFDAKHITIWMRLTPAENNINTHKLPLFLSSGVVLRISTYN